MSQTEELLIKENLKEVALCGFAVDVNILKRVKVAVVKSGKRLESRSTLINGLTSDDVI